MDSTFTKVLTTGIFSVDKTMLVKIINEFFICWMLWWLEVEFNKFIFVSNCYV